MVSERDLIFIGSKFEDFEIPKDKRYLLKYFDSVLQECFLKYFFIFGDWENFVDHTGNACQKRWLQRLEAKLNYIEAAHKTARFEFDMIELAKIENGELEFSKFINSEILYTLKIRKWAEQKKRTYLDLNQLLRELADLFHNCCQNDLELTFGFASSDEPTHEKHVIATVFIGDVIVRPQSVGGTWPDFDDYCEFDLQEQNPN